MILYCRHVPKSKNLGGQVVMGGDNVPPLVEIGLTDPPKSGGAYAPPALCFEWGFTRTFPGNQDVAVK